MYSAFIAKHPIMLAPLAGVGDVVMRQLCIEQGAQLTYTEMVSSKGLAYESPKTEALLERASNEEVVGVQLFGNDPQTMAKEAVRVQDILHEHLACIDINMGCPARKVTGKGDGASLMKTPELAAAIVAAMSKAVDVPVTVKMRRGYFEGQETCVDLARRVEQAGAAAVCVHGRYAEQLYRGTASWDAIARVADALSIPVIGNGDITCGADAVRMREQTNCSGVMVGRAAEGNPWVFADIRAAWDGKEAPSAPTPAQRIALARRHARLLSDKGNGYLVRMRKHAMWYVKGQPGASAARATFTACETIDDYEAAFDKLEQHCAQVNHDA